MPPNDLYHINGDDKVSKGDYFLLVINPNGAELASVIQKISKHEYITLKLKNKTAIIYQVTKGEINTTGSKIDYKEMYRN